MNMPPESTLNEFYFPLREGLYPGDLIGAMEQSKQFAQLYLATLASEEKMNVGQDNKPVAQ